MSEELVVEENKKENVEISAPPVSIPLQGPALLLIKSVYYQVESVAKSLKLANIELAQAITEVFAGSGLDPRQYNLNIETWTFYKREEATPATSNGEAKE